MRRLAYGDACTTSSGTSAGHDCAVSRRSRRVDAALLSLPLADRPRHPRRLERAEALHGGGGAGAVAGQCQSLARLCLLAGRRLARRRFAGGGGRLLEPARLEVEVGWPLLLEQHCRPLGCRVVQPPRGAARGGVGCRPSGCLGEQSGRPFPVDGERALEAGRPRPPAGSMGEGRAALPPPPPLALLLALPLLQRTPTLPRLRLGGGRGTSRCDRSPDQRLVRVRRQRSLPRGVLPPRLP
mmetsp:Transcript_22533/g.73223  ORF Transcript_22533/g.73223 Transcript_22533/m.73223 type:complete len:240 (+) Transcript_22533:247-966(+)